MKPARSTYVDAQGGLMLAPQYRVVIIAGAKRGMWGKFERLEEANAIAAKLRAHGLAATVESDEGPA